MDDVIVHVRPNEGIWEVGHCSQETSEDVTSFRYRLHREVVNFNFKSPWCMTIACRSTSSARREIDVALVPRYEVKEGICLQLSEQWNIFTVTGARLNFD
jgi:hypothetical protein